MEFFVIYLCIGLLFFAKSVLAIYMIKRIDPKELEELAGRAYNDTVKHHASSRVNYLRLFLFYVICWPQSFYNIYKAYSKKVGE